MPCTTILVGKSASKNNSTIISRNDDSPNGFFHIKKMAFYPENNYLSEYKSRISKVIIDLPNYNYSFTYMPNVEKKEGIWGANGVNRLNVSVSATETISNNENILKIDPLINVKEKRHLSRSNTGIGEEDIVMLTLPFIKSARDGVLRLAYLLEQYGTYETNGIIFQDENEIWYMETIGGHHFIAKRLPDDMVAILPNYFNIDSFDLVDALNEKKNHIASSDLMDLIENNKELLNAGIINYKDINPRKLFGTYSELDRCYNTPRSWFMYGYFTNDYDKYNPESPNIPAFIKPVFKVGIEEVKIAQSSVYENTIYDPYRYYRKYRPIGINRTAFLHITEIKSNVKDEELKSINYIGYASNAYNVCIPILTSLTRIPLYFKNTTTKVSTSSFYWTSRLISALSDPIKEDAQKLIKEAQNDIYELSNQIINLSRSNNDHPSIDDINDIIVNSSKDVVDNLLNDILRLSSLNMKNAFGLSDHGES